MPASAGMAAAEQVRNVVWKPELYKLQMEAPLPQMIPALEDDHRVDLPEFYGLEFHGVLDHNESERLLRKTPDGSYLIRKSPGAIDYFTLSLRFDQRTRHYKLSYDPNFGHFLINNAKRSFASVNDLVADGLVNFYMEKHAGPIMKDLMAQTNQSPYITLNRRKLKALSNDLKLKFTQNQHIFGCDSTTTANQRQESEALETDLRLEAAPIEKRHFFKVQTLKGLNWCEMCGHFLWGFSSQGQKCEDCGFLAHHKCHQLVPANCVPDLKNVRGVFGIDLTTLVVSHQCEIPFVVRKCIEEVEARGMLQEGIYRISGFADEIDALKIALDKDGERTDLSAYSNINVIAGTLKMYLRLLPIPLITFQAYPAFIATNRCESVTNQIAAMQNALATLPKSHFNSLKFVIEHLYRVSLEHLENKMTTYNLATVFAPTLIATPPQLIDLSQEILVLATLINNAPVIFKF